LDTGLPGSPDPGKWWELSAALTGYDRRYLLQKLGGIMPELRSGNPALVASAAEYLLMFFDNPALYEHLDRVADNMKTKVPGRTGQRWSETLCAAAWRVFLDSASQSRPDYHFTLVPWVPGRLS
jgi:hypothetical protein